MKLKRKKVPYLTRGHLRGENLENKTNDRYKFGIKTTHKDGGVEIFVPNVPIDGHYSPKSTTLSDKTGWSAEEIYEREVENLDRSSRRARKNIRYHVRNNNHTHFVNLTYDLDKYPTNEKRFDRMKTVLDDLKTKYGLFDYCLVPELHDGEKSDGLIHWHGVMDLSSFDLTRATNYHTGKLLFDDYGRELFNMDYWDFIPLSVSA